MQRVFDTLARYRELIDEHGATATTAVLTSAVRDAANGADFTAIVRERYGLDARTIGGDEEAALTFAGATSERADDGARAARRRHRRRLDGVRHRPRRRGRLPRLDAGRRRAPDRAPHRTHDPPRARRDRPRCAREVAQIIRDHVPGATPARASRTASPSPAPPRRAPRSSSGCDPYDRALVHGHVLRARDLRRHPRPARAPDRRRAARRHRPAARPRAHDRRRRRDAARGLRRLRPRARSRSPSTTSCAAPPCGSRRRQRRQRLVHATHRKDGRMSESSRARPCRYSPCRQRGPSPSIKGNRAGHRSGQAVRSAPPTARTTQYGHARYVPLPVLRGQSSGSRPFPWGRLPSFRRPPLRPGSSAAGRRPTDRSAR